MPEKGTERGGGGDHAGGDRPQALIIGEMRPGNHDGSSGCHDGAPAGSMLLAGQAVIRLEQPGARTVKQVAEKRLGFIIAAELRHAGVGFRGVTGLGAADSPDDPPNRGGPSVVASPVEGQAEEADSMQQRDGESGALPRSWCHARATAGHQWRRCSLVNSPRRQIGQ